MPDLAGVLKVVLVGSRLGKPSVFVFFSSGLHSWFTSRSLAWRLPPPLAYGVLALPGLSFFSFRLRFFMGLFLRLFLFLPLAPLRHGLFVFWLVTFLVSLRLLPFVGGWNSRPTTKLWARVGSKQGLISLASIPELSSLQGCVCVLCSC